MTEASSQGISNTMGFRSIPTDAIFRKRSNIVMHDVMGEILFVRVEDDVANTESLYSTNEVGARVWELMDSERSVSDIIGILAEEYDESAEVISGDVMDFITAMSHHGIIEPRAGLQ